MKKVLIGIAVLAVAAGTALFLYRDRIGTIIAFSRLKPELAFAQAVPPVAPDYAEPQSWAALPDRQDDADVLPGDDVQDRQATAEVDVFFVHPTTFFGTAAWNQPLDDSSTNQLTDMFVLRGQASVFNSCCKIYAPRYRQATIYSFMDKSGSGASALATRIRATSSARSTTLSSITARAGRSSSPRTARARCTCARCWRNASPALRCASGWSPRIRSASASIANVMAKSVPDVPVCQSAEQTGCVVTWNCGGSAGEEVRRHRARTSA